MNSAPTPLRAWLIGADSLLVQCAESLLRQGHAIEGVITSTPRIGAWAAERSIRVVPADSAYTGALSERPFDVLFSITHLAVIPREALALPRRLAVNFHDGPLPRYAGLNTPAWAIMRGEPTYAITWHVITPEVDRGAMLAQIPFDIAPRETALTLNSRCFEAAVDSFDAIVADIAAGRERPRPQPEGAFNYFTRAQRPAGGGVLDWSRPAHELDALVRALDFGRYTNPLASAKVFHAGKPIVITRAEARPAPGALAPAPGTVLSVSPAEIVVATADGALALQGFASLCGGPLPVEDASRSLGVAAGGRFDAISPQLTARLDAFNARCAKHEGALTARLASLEPADLPGGAGVSAESGRDSVAFTAHGAFAARYAGPGAAGALGAAFGAFLWRSGEKRAFDLAYRDEAIASCAAGLEAWACERLPLRVALEGSTTLGDAVDRIGAEISRTSARSGLLRDAVGRHADLHGRHDLFDLRLLPVGIEMPGASAGAAAPAQALTLRVTPDGAGGELLFDRGAISRADVERLRDRFGLFLERIASRPEATLAETDVLTPDEFRRVTTEWNATDRPLPADGTVIGEFERQAALTPDLPAVTHRSTTLTYRELNARANALALRLRERGVGPDALVGIYAERSAELLVCVLATLKAGGAYVPLDPSYPRERVEFMVEDSRAPVILTSRALAGTLGAHQSRALLYDAATDLVETNPAPAARPSDLAYVIYTSGSTGKPKGVMVERRNVAAFFGAMDERIPRSGSSQDVWLAVTSLSFDISVLELLWTVTRGLRVVVYDDGRHKTPAPGPATAPRVPGSVGFSLFYFASDQGERASDKYRLLLEGARFADAHGFEAVWTPERHFHAFGGLYPNPSITSAAIAGITTRIAIRAGSVVLPLHHPARIAEEWSLVDNLSNGRVGCAFASGWQPVDFVLRPEAHADRHARLYEGIETVRRLWRGEAVEFPGPDGAPRAIRTLPRPVQPELPVWVTTAGNVETWKSAGAIGANVLTHLLGQTPDEVAAKVRAYREARAAAGHAGPGLVTIMLHTFVGDDTDAVREIVRKPMKEYLASSISLVKDVASSWAALKKRTDGTQAAAGVDIASLTPEEMDGLLEFSFERYFATSGLFGDTETCLALVERLRAAGIDEIACLIDFGVPSELALEHLGHLDRLRELASPSADSAGAHDEAPSVGALIRAHKVTHLQCTPSMAGMLLEDDETRAALSAINVLMIGGEAFPVSLAASLSEATGAAIINMYGPTETTIWSSTHALERGAKSIPIGRPIANTTFYIVDRHNRPTPVGAPGELLIGGAGVVRGYLHRPELTAERFAPDPFRPGQRVYRTGDLARFRPDGVVEFLGRADHQVKIRGHRIELGEIETVLSAHPLVREAVVVAREEAGDKRLVAFVTPKGEIPSAPALRAFVRERLPEFMTPTSVHVLSSFPLTPNRKVDRAALMASKAPTPSSSRPTVAPAGPGAARAGSSQEVIVQVWREALGLQDIGMDDNFFDLGGHSLLAVKAQRLLKQALERDVSITDLFRFPTVRALAGHLDGQGADASRDHANARGAARRELLTARQNRLRPRAAAAREGDAP